MLSRRPKRCKANSESRLWLLWTEAQTDITVGKYKESLVRTALSPP